MNVIELQNKLILEPELIETVLTKLGHVNIRDRGAYYQTSNLDGDNSTAISIVKENLVYSNFTRGEKGNLFSLVMREKSCDFPRALEYVSHWIGFKKSHIAIHKPFNGFYEKLIRSDTQPESTMKTYSESDLPPKNNLSAKWVKDGVSLQVQEKYGIRYDHITNGIIIPAHNYEGKLVGAKWRNNDKCALDERWGMYIPYSKSNIVWGYNEHYKSIQSKSVAVVVEAEKSVLQSESFGFNLCLAIGGHDLSSTQVKYLRSLMCNKIILGFDEGLHEEEIIFQANKLKSNTQSGYILNKNTQIGYIFDSEHKYLKTGSKDSPTDNGRDVFEKLIKECVVWI